MRCGTPPGRRELLPHAHVHVSDHSASPVRWIAQALPRAGLAHLRTQRAFANLRRAHRPKHPERIFAARSLPVRLSPSTRERLLLVFLQPCAAPAKCHQRSVPSTVRAWHGGKVGTRDIHRAVSDREGRPLSTLPPSGSFGKVALSLPTAGTLLLQPVMCRLPLTSHHRHPAAAAPRPRRPGAGGFPLFAVLAHASLLQPALQWPKRQTTGWHPGHSLRPRGCFRFRTVPDESSTSVTDPAGSLPRSKLRYPFADPH